MESQNEDIVTFTLEGGKQMRFDLSRWSIIRQDRDKTVYQTPECYHEKPLFELLHKSKHPRAREIFERTIKARMVEYVKRGLFLGLECYELVDYATGIAVTEGWDIENVLIEVIEKLDKDYRGGESGYSDYYVLGAIAVKRYAQIGISRNKKQEVAEVLSKHLLNDVLNEYMSCMDPRVEEALLGLEIDLAEIVKSAFQSELENGLLHVVALNLETATKFGIDPLSVVPNKIEDYTFWTGKLPDSGHYGRQAFQFIIDNYPEFARETYYRILNVSNDDTNIEWDDAKEFAKLFGNRVPRYSLEEALKTDDKDIYFGALYRCIMEEDRTLFLEWLQRIIDEGSWDWRVGGWITTGIRQLFCKDSDFSEQPLTNSTNTSAVILISVLCELHENMRIRDASHHNLIVEFYKHLMQEYKMHQNERDLEVLREKFDGVDYCQSKTTDSDVLRSFMDDGELWMKAIRTMVEVHRE